MNKRFLLLLSALFFALAGCHKEEKSDKGHKKEKRTRTHHERKHHEKKHREKKHHEKKEKTKKEHKKRVTKKHKKEVKTESGSGMRPLRTEETEETLIEEKGMY